MTPPEIPRGSPVPGSAFLRDICNECGAEIRVIPSCYVESVMANHCDDCYGANPPPRAHRLVHRQQIGRSKTDS